MLVWCRLPQLGAILRFCSPQNQQLRVVSELGWQALVAVLVAAYSARNIALQNKHSTSASKPVEVVPEAPT